MLELLKVLDVKNLSFLKICSDKVLCQEGEGASPSRCTLQFCGQNVGSLESNLEGKAHDELAQQVAPLLYLYKEGYPWEQIILLQQWVKGARDLVSDIADWIGIYYKANYYLSEQTTDLILGPYYGESTTHTRIPLERGLCGLALREERVVNVADVHEDSRHIACSLKTNSELIIPLTNSEGKMVAELDIDCNRLGAFTSDIEEKFRGYSQSFSKNWDKK